MDARLCYPALRIFHQGSQAVVQPLTDGAQAETLLIDLASGKVTLSPAKDALRGGSSVDSLGLLGICKLHTGLRECAEDARMDANIRAGQATEGCGGGAAAEGGGGVGVGVAQANIRAGQATEGCGGGAAAEIHGDFGKHGFFLARGGGVVERRQGGVIRTNCIDCLDRTNVVQGIVGRKGMGRGTGGGGGGGCSCSAGGTGHHGGTAGAGSPGLRGRINAAHGSKKRAAATLSRRHRTDSTGTPRANGPNSFVVRRSAESASTTSGSCRAAHGPLLLGLPPPQQPAAGDGAAAAAAAAAAGLAAATAAAGGMVAVVTGGGGGGGGWLVLPREARHDKGDAPEHAAALPLGALLQLPQRHGGGAAGALAQAGALGGAWVAGAGLAHQEGAAGGGGGSGGSGSDWGKRGAAAADAAAAATVDRAAVLRAVLSRVVMPLVLGLGLLGLVVSNGKHLVNKPQLCPQLAVTVQAAPKSKQA
ncbi:Phosphatidylinositide phosphatase SAC1 [Tetrabaena socialis]|uniref:Phosphatidylinositide phosphatase SAC1 n=1 Tax=Tetrabaena socialis TaxID=47790 RepID=A0A2J7ZVI6_9CHLO|nr:Phosphatidylinositide phosphatase SAC1 [Tetrabaena socialis]|eukprot:PNH04270.1 Phosphatidylinositide phosphatase SAC1 [Tetrabaena socialis]